MMGIWFDRAWQVIRAVHKTLPEDTDLKARKKATDEAYPFGEREYWPYKAWLQARRKYLIKYGYIPRGYVEPMTLPHMSPLERMKAKAEAPKP